MHLTTITGALEQQMSLLLQDLAQHYSLDYKDLHTRYLGERPRAPTPVVTQKLPAKIVRAAGRKAKLLDDVPEGEPTQEILDGVKLPGLKRFCKAHGIPSTNTKKNELIERCLEFLRNPAAVRPAKKKGGRRKKNAAPEPVCEHSLNAESHASCSQCREYGNVFEEVTSKKKDWTLAMSATKPSELIPEPIKESEEPLGPEEPLKETEEPLKESEEPLKESEEPLGPEETEEPLGPEETEWERTKNSALLDLEEATSAMNVMRSMLGDPDDPVESDDEDENDWAGYNEEPSPSDELCASDYM